jgi:glutamate--cysteine ligase
MSLDNRPEQSPPLTERAQLLQPFHAAMKPVARHRIGLEHESVGFLGTAPIPFAGPRGIEALLQRFGRYGFERFVENRHTIAMLEPEGAQVSLEPGGQVELAGSPFTRVADVAAEQAQHFARLRAFGAEQGLRFTSLGYRPFGTTADGLWMSKERYVVMRAYLGARAKLGLDMMLMTGTAQCSVDYTDEEDLAHKVAASTSAGPLVTALFAASPLVDSKPSGFLSYRMHVWEEVDPDRTGLLAFGARAFTLDRYVDWALDAPLIFLRRNGQYLSPKGMRFRDFMERGFGEARATTADWADHLTTLFPDSRVKSVLELRTADASGPDLAVALVALWKGVLYDRQAAQETVALTEMLSDADRQQLRREVSRRALGAPVGRFQVRQLAVELVSIARRGLVRQGCADETDFLEPLAEIAHSGITRAERMLRAFERGGPEAVIALMAV